MYHRELEAFGYYLEYLLNSFYYIVPESNLKRKLTLGIASYFRL